MQILATYGLTRRFEETTAVDGLTIEIQPGEIFGLLGPNGAGKSTAIKMLTTLLPPSAGRATVAGFDVVRQPLQVRRAVGYVPQALSADGSLTGYENLLIFAKLYDLPRLGRPDRIREALAFMGLGEAADKLVRSYSGGMIRRLEIAQSILHRPRLLFLDEPTVGLDPVARRTVWDLIARLRAESGTTVLMTTHFMEEAEVLCQRVAILHRGKMVTQGSPTELKALIGRPEASLDQVFIHFTGDNLEAGGNYRDTARTRRTARRLG